MDTKRLIRQAMAARGLNGVKLSAQMNRGKNYISDKLTRDNAIQVDTLEEIARSMGYRLEISFVDESTGKRIEA